MPAVELPGVPRAHSLPPATVTPVPVTPVNCPRCAAACARDELVESLASPYVGDRLWVCRPCREHETLYLKALIQVPGPASWPCDRSLRSVLEAFLLDWAEYGRFCMEAGLPLPDDARQAVVRLRELEALTGAQAETAASLWVRDSMPPREAIVAASLL